MYWRLEKFPCKADQYYQELDPREGSISLLQKLRDTIVAGQMSQITSGNLIPSCWIESIVEK